MISPGRVEAVCTASRCSVCLCVCVCLRACACAGMHVTCTYSLYVCVCVCVCGCWGGACFAACEVCFIELQAKKSVSASRHSSPSKWKAALSLSARLTQLSRETCSYYCGRPLVRGTQTAQNKSAFDRKVKKRLHLLSSSPLMAFFKH